MSEQDGAPSSTKQRRSRKTNTANQQNGKQAPAAQRPVNDDTEAWKEYWKTQGQSWRTEPEIDTERQEYLTERRCITPNIEQGIYPFKNFKLSRADVEWLLATHENGRGPVDWKDESQQQHEGVDLRGADLSQTNLKGLPLARMRGGLGSLHWYSEMTEQEKKAVVQLQGANLTGAQLQGANLTGAQLQEAYLSLAQLQGAKLDYAQLQGAWLEYALLQEAHLFYAQLQGAWLEHALLQGANLEGAQLQKADLRVANLQEANLRYAQLQGANLGGARLQGANLVGARLQGADLRRANLEHAILDWVCFSDQTYGPVRVADINWGDVNLAVVNWRNVSRLGDERLAYRTNAFDDYRRAVRANRQIAVALREQGLNEEADHFAYRAQKLQHIVLRRQRKFGRYLFFGFLDLLAGYGYRPGRSVFWYLAIVCGFALAYHLLGQLSLFPPDAFVYSLTSFHGRGFFPGLEHRTSLHDPLIMLAALEAVVGLFIEISFIATFTQRFFGR